MSDSAEALAERGNRGFQVLARLQAGHVGRRRAGGARRHLAAARAGVSSDQREARRRGQPARRRAGRRLPSGAASADGGGRLRAADRVRQRRQPAARPLGGAAARDCRPHRDRRGLGAAAASADHGKRRVDERLRRSSASASPSSRSRGSSEFAPVSFPSFVQPHVNARVAVFTIAVCARVRIDAGPGAGGARTRRSVWRRR